MKYVIWGCGQRGKKLIDIMGQQAVIAIIDSDINQQGREIGEIPIISYEKYKEQYLEYPVWVTPANAEEDIINILAEDNVPYISFSGIGRSRIDFNYLGKENAFDMIESMVGTLKCIYLYGLNSYSLVLFEYLKKKGKNVKLIRDNDLDSEMLHCLEEQFPEDFAVMSDVGNDIVCSTGFDYNNKLKKESTVNLYWFEKDMPFIYSYNAALEYEENPFNSEKRERKITVSLTSHDERIQYVSYAIGTMLHQTMKPDRVVLYLDKDKDVQLPKSLLKQVECGVEIHYVEDIKPHTKYFYAFKEYPEDIIITIDDDRLYRLDLIEKLYASYSEYPKCVSAMHINTMYFDENGELKNYIEWGTCLAGDYEIRTPSMRYFALGYGGVLYPPKCMHKEIFNIDNIRVTCLKADDLWLKVMETLNNVPVVAVEKASRWWMSVSEIQEVQGCALYLTNCGEGKNDMQMRDILKIYNKFLPNEPSVLDKIRLNLY